MELSWDIEIEGYAQSPQALVFKDFVRIYFSTRTMDKLGKYISHVKYVDFTLDFSKVLNHSCHQVVPKSETGTFDEHGIFPMNVIRVGDKILGYTNGWSRRQSVDVETGIGFLVSNNDGQTFERPGLGPILSSTINEPFLVGDPFVISVPGGFRMWYIFGQKWNIYENNRPAERVYKITEATSNNGVDWVKSNKKLIKDVLGQDECQALPTVVYFEDYYHMFFCYRRDHDFRKNKNNSYRIGYAKSKNMQDWERDEDYAGLQRSNEGWDSQMICYPNVFKLDGKIHLLYNGNEFGRHGFGLATLE